MMPTQIKSKPGLKNFFGERTEEVRNSFEHLPALLDAFPMDVSLAYVFARLELGQNMALYCGAVGIHKANAEVAKNAVGAHHMTRDGFVELYKAVFDCNLPAEAHQDLKSAESVRDKVMHEKAASDDQIRNAIARALEYAEELNQQLHTKHGLRPYGNLKGFAGKSKKFDKRTTRFLLKGLGFGIA
jgi:hypothetical protein